MRPYTIEEHWEAGVRASMLRPRLMWSSISPAQPAIRPKRKAVKAALSRASSENAPERQRCQCVFESNAAMTASMFTQKALGVTPRPSSPFSSAQTSRRSVRQRIPAILSFLSVYRSAIATFAGSCCRRSDAYVSSCRKIRLRGGAEGPRAPMQRGLLLVAHSSSRVRKQTGRKRGNFNLDETESGIYRSKAASWTDGTPIA